MDYNLEFKMLSEPHHLSKTYATLSQKEQILANEKVK